MINKYSFFVIALLCAVMSGFGQGSESFNNLNAAAGSYGNSSYVGDNGVTWTYGEGRLVTATYNITGTSIGFNATGTRFASALSGANGVGTLNYSVRSYFTGGVATDRTMEVYVNGSLVESYTLAAMNTVYNRSVIVNQTGNVTIEFRSTGARQIVLDTISWTTATTTTVDFCNVQSPPNGNITVGTAFPVYAQVYKAGVTEAPGAGAGITAWIGYSTTNNNPNLAGWTWKAATFNTQVGNNDEFVANIGTLPTLASGTYYYASRFRISGGPYSYGGYNVGGGGFWNGTSNVSGVLSVDTVDFANLQFPEVGTIAPGGTFDVYGQVFEQGVTPGAGQGAGIVAQVGYSTSNTNPNTWTSWVATTYNPGCTNTCNSSQNDEYQVNLGASLTAPGTYYYATRFRLNSGIWLYGGILSNGTAGNFWDGTTYISGVVNVIAPEIDIERNTNASIPTGSAASTGFNTVFAAETIGNTSSGKTFYIHNEGTANLTVTSLVSLNAVEFPVTFIPAVTFPLIIAPGNLVEFEIAFAPNSILPTSNRTSIITVRSNDADEDPYTFNVRGTANCAATSLTINPISGPVGTVVTVQGTNFGAATTAKFNGTTATVTLISSTLIEVVVPAGATTGSLEVTNQIGCKSSAFFTIIKNLITSCQGIGTLPSDLFISEITDKGSGSHSYIEIYNGTGATINMGTGNYQVRIHNNGNATATASINLTGNIPNNAVRVLALGGTNATDPEGGYTANFFSGTGGVNDDDNIRLYKGAGAGTWIDLWGDTTGTAFTITSKDYVYRRKNSGIPVPSTTWNPNDWDAFTPVDYSNIGIYDFSVGIPPSVTVQPIAPISSCDLTATLSVAATEGFSGGFALAYQWYVSAPLPAATTWTPVANGGVYTGATTSTLAISNTLNLDNYQYYCQVRENAATCYTASNAVRVKVQKSTWNGTTWSPVAPTISSIAVLNGDYDMSTTGDNRPSFSACQLLINSTSTLTIEDNKFVEVQNNVTVDGNVIIRTKGALVQNNNAGLVNGAVLTTRSKIVVEKMTSLLNNWYEYTYWSSPVSGETIAAGLAESQANRRFWFNAANFRDSFRETGNNNVMVLGQDDIDDDANDWTLAPGGMTMSPGVGYASTLNSAGFMGAGTRYKFTFEGPFNNGVVNVPVLRNDAELLDNDWNLIGNPYPSAISANAFFTQNLYNLTTNPSGTLEGAIYLWSQNTAPSGTTNGNENQNFAQSDYATINGASQTAGGDGITPTRFIPSGQGFFVTFSKLRPTTTGNAVFNNAMRMKDNTSNNQFFRGSSSGEEISQGLIDNKLWLNLTSNNGVFNQISIAYVQGASDGNDGAYYDAPRNLSNGAYSILYSIIDNEPNSKLAIQGKEPNSLGLDERISLGFSTSINEATTYRLSISNLQGAFLTENAMYLKDNLMGITHNLSASDYSFTSQNGEFNTRFEIVFRDQSLSIIENEITPNGLSIIELPSGHVKFVVGNNLEIKSVEIIDMLGRTLYNLKGNSPSEVYELSNLSQAAYIAKVTLSNGQVITKRAVKRN